MQISAAGVAQNNITLNEKNVPLHKVLKLVEKQSGFIFFYEKATLNNAPDISIHVKNASVQDVLNICFKDQPFDFTIEGNTIGIKRKDITKNNVVPGTPTAATIQPPPIIISGRVTDSTGTPLGGVTVLLKGTQIETVTDNKGNYSLTVSEKKGTLVFSYVGLC